MSIWRKTKTSGTGKSGHRSSRWMTRREAKENAKKLRRREGRRATQEEPHE